MKYISKLFLLVVLGVTPFFYGMDGVGCVICQDSEESSEFFTLPCDHAFHETCLDQLMAMPDTYEIPFDSVYGSYDLDITHHKVCPSCRCYIGAQEYPIYKEFLTSCKDQKIYAATRYALELEEIAQARGEYIRDHELLKKRVVRMLGATMRRKFYALKHDDMRYALLGVLCSKVECSGLAADHSLKSTFGSLLSTLCKRSDDKDLLVRSNRLYFHTIPYLRRHIYRRLRELAPGHYAPKRFYCSKSKRDFERDRAVS